MEKYLKKIEKYNTVFDSIIKSMPEISTSELEYLMKKKLKHSRF